MNVTTSMPKSMYLSMSVSEEVHQTIPETLHQSVSIWSYFLKSQKSHAFLCILLKNTKAQTEKSQEEEMAVIEINIAFATPVPILSDNTFTTFK